MFLEGKNMYKDLMDKKLEEIKNKDSVKILAIESSCDETSVAIVENGRKVLSCVIDTQIEIHKRFGGVVPEVASRNHILAIDNVTKEALTRANLTFDDIDLIAVTYGAGLLGALLVGVNYAKGLAYALNKPLLAINHIKGHIASNYISHEDLTPPFTCLLISGGHTAILDVESYTKFTKIGATVDDAVGEAFDKVARVMGLSYPGGVNIDKYAKEGESNINFAHKNILAGTYNFSFSGIKTAVVSNKPDYGVQALVKQFFDGLFDVSIGEREGVNKKPAPDMVNLALNALNVPKTNAVYIGDSDVDFNTAANSELKFIGVAWGFKGHDFLKELGSKFVVDTADELTKLIISK